MNYSISSEKFSNPLLKDLLQALSSFFASKNVSFYVIGATARDIIMRQLLDQESARHTQDLDIAIAISEWDKFEEISLEIAQLKDFEKSIHQKQRFHFCKDYELDLVPFGAIAKDDGNIYWPPEEEFRMSVKGFDEALKDFMIIKIDDEFEIRVASLSGLFLLKLNAWIDRNISTSKDAEDLCYIIENYYAVFEECNIARGYHQEIYEMENFDVFVAGAIWLGYDIVALLTHEQAVCYNSMLISELQKEEESRLIEQMMKQSISVSYEMVHSALSEISSILQQNNYNEE